MSPSQRATCHILSGHKESTSPFEAAEGVGQIKVAVEKVAEKAVAGRRDRKRWQKRWLQQRSLGRQIRDRAKGRKMRGLGERKKGDNIVGERGEFC